MDTLNNNLKSEVFQSYAYLSRVKEQRFVVGANYKSAVLVYAESGAVLCLSVSGKGYLPTYHNGARGVFVGVQTEIKALVSHGDKLTHNFRTQLFSGSRITKLREAGAFHGRRWNDRGLEHVYAYAYHEVFRYSARVVVHRFREYSAELFPAGVDIVHPFYSRVNSADVLYRTGNRNRRA